MRLKSHLPVAEIEQRTSDGPNDDESPRSDLSETFVLPCSVPHLTIFSRLLSRPARFFRALREGIFDRRSVLIIKAPSILASYPLNLLRKTIQTASVHS
jgi:hypothetical protein